MGTQQETDEAAFSSAFRESAAALEQGSDLTQQSAPASTPPLELSAGADDKVVSIVDSLEPGGVPSSAPQVSVEHLPADTELQQVQAQNEQLRHKERSASERIGAFQRKINEAEAKNAELTRQLNEFAATKAATAASTPGEDDELQALLADMPELGRVVDRLVSRKVHESAASIQAEIRRVEGEILPLRDRAAQQAQQAELAVVEAEFPQWREVVFAEPFKQWISSKPPGLRNAYDTAQTGADCLEFMRMYQRETQPVATPLAEQQPTPTAAASADKRAKLANAVGVPSRATTRAPLGLPSTDDFDSAFQYFSKLT